MTRKSEEVLVPRNGAFLKVGIPTRISGCQNQKELSLEDQADNAKETVRDLYQGPVDYDVFETKAKGERLDRPELEQIEAAYKSGQFDLFVFDDLSRLIRGGEAARLLGVGVDHGTRTICIADGIDTAEPTWEQDALNACGENVAHNQRTSMRIKQKEMNRFKKFGKTAKRPIMGYIVAADATTFDDWAKDLALEPFILEGARILRRTLNGEATAEYFRRNTVPLGLLARNDAWNGTMVLRYYRNPLLKGMPQRGKMATVKHFGSGRRPSKKNPKGPSHFPAPHLAFFSHEEFDELIALLENKNKGRGRKPQNGVDPRLNVPRKRTRSFGQHTRCWYCGRHLVWGANGIKDSLMCSGAREWKCWNSIGMPGAIAEERIIEAITNRLYSLDDFDNRFRAMIHEAHDEGSDGLAARRQQLCQNEASLASDREKLKEMIFRCGHSLVLEEMLADLGRRATTLAAERKFLETAKKRRLEIPASTGELREVVEGEFNKLCKTSLDFGELIRRMVPEMYVYLVRLCDGGHLLPRAKVRVNLLGGFPDGELAPALEQLLRFELTLDLFVPPERERIRQDVIRYAQSGMQQREIAGALPTKSTQAAVWKAIELNRKMNWLQMPSPYALIESPPDDYSKLRRHKNAKYHFERLNGYEPPTL